MNIILDVDGTIWDTTEVVAKSWMKAVCEVVPEDSPVRDRVITGATLKKEFGKPMDEIAADLFPETDEETRTKLMDACAVHEQEDLEACSEDLTYPGVKETIKHLAKDNNVYIVSNCQSGYIELVIKKLGIKEYIKDFECFGNTNKYKAENIRMVIERNTNGCACDMDFFYVGDTAGDFRASAEAQVPFIFASYGFGTEEEIAAAEAETGKCRYGSIISFEELKL